MNGSKREFLNNIIMIIVLYLALEVNNILPGFNNIPWFVPVSLLTATGIYVMLINSFLFIIPKSELLMRIYWGKLYLNGFWSYVYTRDGKEYFGIWRFEQDLDKILVVGSGLTENFTPRTVVRSVSPLIHEQGAYFVLNVRQELDHCTGFITPVYSKTTIIIDSPKNILKPVTTLRATTEIYGGSSNGHLHPDVIFKKHIDAKSDEDVINYLRDNIKKSSD